MTFELGRALLISGAVSPGSLAEALFAVSSQGLPLVRALVTVGAIGERRLEDELARLEGPVLQNVRPVPGLMDRLPPGICIRLAAVPVRLDARTGVVDVAVLDTTDPHPAAEIGYHLRAPARAVRASLEAIREALELHPAAIRALAPPMRIPPSSEWDSDDRPSTLPRARSDVPIPLSRRAPVTRITGAWKNDSPADEAVNEPVFELRRAPPVTLRDAAPPPFSTRPSQPVAAFPLRAPLTSIVPVSPNAPVPPFADVSALLEGMASASDRDTVIRITLNGIRSVARKVGVLVVRKDGVVGWACTPELGDESAFRAMVVPLEGPSPLTTVLGSGGTYLGPLMGTMARPFLAVIKGASHDVAITAVRVSGRPTLVLVADELGDTFLATKRIEEFARAAGEALERIVRAKRV